jgi:hypothetical protein
MYSSFFVVMLLAEDWVQSKELLNVLINGHSKEIV